MRRLHIYKLIRRPKSIHAGRRSMRRKSAGDKERALSK
jgi:hypothetical protein